MNLPDLCRYYLRCLSVANQGGVVVAQNSNTDYVELPSHPSCDPWLSNLLDYPGVSALVNLTQTGQPKKELMLGYPICRMREPSDRGWRDVLKPIFIAELRSAPDDVGKGLFAEGNLTLNPGVLGSLDAVGNGDVMSAVVALTEELGLDQETLPLLDELCTRLRELRPAWPWMESIVPSLLSQNGGLASLSQNGIYNRAMVLAADPSNFTKGLEVELAAMESLSDQAVAGTALDSWLRRDFSNFQTPPGAGMSLLEPLALNSEQREAVERALSQPLTVVTGPPGTGKSQVVSTLLINAAVRGMRVIFSSKNNKAVDVVEQRVNDLGSLPILLRMGSQAAFQQNLQSHLAGLLGAQVSSQERKEFAEAQSDYQKLEAGGAEIQQMAVALIDLRNQVDHAEQAVESIRKMIDDELFQRLRGEDAGEIERVAKQITTSAQMADQSRQPWLVRLLWWFLKTRRIALLNEFSAGTREILGRVHVNFPSCHEENKLVKAWTKVGDELARRADQTRAIAEYSRLLMSLTHGDRLEDFMAALDVNQKEKAIVSKRVWDGWLRVMPDRLTAEARVELGNFASVLKTILQIKASGGNVPNPVWANFFQLLPKVSSYLPCWAVTALSVHKRFPFFPGTFDLLIIDEASQCDIAAILPLLYRAKAVVIIGDPKQLNFISALPAAVDADLLHTHGLSEHPIWGYSVNSVYDLAVTMADSANVVQLLDHHRSHADIIGFSVQEFYNAKLRIATDYRKLMMIDPALPAIQWIDLLGVVTRNDRDGIVNVAEAQKVVKVLERLVLVRNYQGSMGVVTPFRGQANRIRQLIRQNPALDAALNRRNFMVETAHGFQGDERDVMIFSPVVSANTPQGALTFLKRTGNVFNVAVTRARAGLIVVGDKQAARNFGVSHLASFVGYVERLSVSRTPKTYPPVAKLDLVSGWEECFYSALQEKGILSTPQYNVDKYILDFALFDNDRRLNIEIDGEHYHRDWNGDLLQRDQLRNMRLRELGWDVMRFWVYEVRDEMEPCIQRVQQWLDSEESR